MENARKFRQLSTWVVPALCVMAALLALTFPLQDPDTFWHLSYGRAMVEQGRFINHEMFSYTAAGTYLGSHSQLAQVLLYLIWLGGGANALLGFKLLVGLATFLIVMRTSRLFDLGRTPSAVIALMVILAGMSRFVERPELFSILLQAFVVLLLFGYGRGAYGVRALCILPVTLVAWDYLHGALFGLTILLTFTFGETLKTYIAPRRSLLSGWCANPLSLKRLKPLWIWSAITLVAMSFHPNGLLNYSGFWRISSKASEYAMYGEFMPTRFIPQFFWFWICTAIVLFLCVLCIRRLDLTALLVVIPFLYLGLKYNRATLAFCLAAVPLATHCLTSAGERWRSVKGWRGVATALTIVILLAVPFYKELYAPDILRFGSGLNNNAFPVGSTRFVQDVGLNGNMFNTDGAGGYLSFFLAPKWKIFNYNQPGVFTALTEYVHKPKSRSRWDIRYAIIAEAKEYDMFQRDGFVPVYWEPNGMVLLKATPEHAALIEKYQIHYFAPLKPWAELEALSKDPLASTRLCEEISIYLTYRRDARIAAFLGQLLQPANLDVRAGLGQRRIWLEAALRENQGSLPLLQPLGEVAYRQGDLALAEGCFDEILTQDPTNIAVLLNRGYLDYDRKAYREAKEIFAKAVKVAEFEADPHYALGLAALRMGDRALMEKEFKVFLQLTPESPYAENAKRLLAEGGL